MLEAGQTLGRLTLIKRRIKNKRSQWLCQCECGSSPDWKDQWAITHGHTVSCGCYRSTQTRSQRDKTVGVITSARFNRIKRRAKILKLPFDLTKEFLNELFEKQARKCAITNKPISFDVHHKMKNMSNRTTASIDRIDSSKGYTQDNVQWVHERVNFMKHDMSLDELKDWCESILSGTRPSGT